MKNRVIKTFEEFAQKIEIEDSTVHFHFGDDSDYSDRTSRTHKPGDEVMVDLPLVKLNKVGGETEPEEPQEIENLENPEFDLGDADYDKKSDNQDDSEDIEDDEENENDDEDE